MKESEVKVSVCTDYSAEVIAGKHQLLIDEPLHLGGKDKGADPYSYIMSALGACTAITVRMYADRKKWKLERVEVLLNHTRVHSLDCEHCEDPAYKMDTIRKEIKFFGELSEDQKIRLKTISTKCPVQKTLEAGIHIETI